MFYEYFISFHTLPLLYVLNLLVHNLHSLVKIRTLVSYIICLFDSAVCVKFMIDCVCDGEQPFDPAEHESTRLCLSHQKASLHGLALVGSLHLSCKSLMLDQTHSLKRGAAFISLSLSLLVVLSVFLCIF